MRAESAHRKRSNFSSYKTYSSEAVAIQSHSTAASNAKRKLNSRTYQRLGEARPESSVRFLVALLGIVVLELDVDVSRDLRQGSVGVELVDGLAAAPRLDEPRQCRCGLVVGMCVISEDDPLRNRLTICVFDARNLLSFVSKYLYIEQCKGWSNVFIIVYASVYFCYDFIRAVKAVLDEFSEPSPL